MSNLSNFKKIIIKREWRWFGLWSISSTFYACVFCTKAHFWRRNFIQKRCAQLCNFWRQNIGEKSAQKMLMKLTPTLHLDIWGSPKINIVWLKHWALHYDKNIEQLAIIIHCEKSIRDMCHSNYTWHWVGIRKLNFFGEKKVMWEWIE